MATPDVVEAYLQEIHVTATKAEALSDANTPKTLKKLDIPDSIELRELKYLNNSKGLTQHSPGFRTMKGTLEMDVAKGSAIIALIRSSYAARTPFFVHVIEDSTATAGSKGWVYECVCGSYPQTREAGPIMSVSIELGINDFTAI